MWQHRDSIGSGIGLFPDGTKPLPETMLTYYRPGPMAFIWCHYHKNWIHQSIKQHCTQIPKRPIRVYVCYVQMMGQMSQVGFQSLASMDSWYVTIEINDFWIWIWIELHYHHHHHCKHYLYHQCHVWQSYVNSFTCLLSRSPVLCILWVSISLVVAKDTHMLQAFLRQLVMLTSHRGTNKHFLLQ